MTDAQSIQHVVSDMHRHASVSRGNLIELNAQNVGDDVLGEKFGTDLLGNLLFFSSGFFAHVIPFDAVLLR
jgi:hypothetical protein